MHWDCMKWVLQPMKQINLQMSLNPENKSHMDLLNWIDDQTTNRSSFIREAMFMRMSGSSNRKSVRVEGVSVKPTFDVDEVKRLLF